MTVTLICVGSEILDGRTINTNAAFVGQRLRGKGIVVSSVVTVDDSSSAITQAVRQAMASSRFVMTIGGLGPTTDDVTKESIADELGLDLALDETVSNVIQDRFKRLGRTIPDAARIKQATLPVGAEVITNDWGIAPGLWIDRDGCSLCMMPGPPREFEPMFDTSVLPRLATLMTGGVLGRTFRILGIGEATVQDRVQAILDAPDTSVGYCVVPGGVDVTMTLSSGDEKQLTAIATSMDDAFGKHLATTDETLVTRICEGMRERGGIWGVAESCTGGMIASSVIDEAGVSDVFAGGVVTYSNELKRNLLGVADQSLSMHGAVSEVVAREMVTGLGAKLSLDAGIAVTGIAGPDGGTPEKPAGTVFIATMIGSEIRCTRHCFPYGRRGMRERTAITALRQLWRQLEGIDD